ncbi:hypothetical protein AAGS39_48140 [Flavobacterium sp. CGRL2]
MIVFVSLAKNYIKLKKKIKNIDKDIKKSRKMIFLRPSICFAKLKSRINPREIRIFAHSLRFRIFKIYKNAVF